MTIFWAATALMLRLIQVAAEWLEVRDDVAPEIRRGGIAVQQHDRVARSHLRVRHFAAQDLAPLFFVGKCRRNHLRHC